MFAPVRIRFGWLSWLALATAAHAQPPEAAKPSYALDAEIRLRAGQSGELSTLQAGLDQARRGVFQRSRLGATFDAHGVQGRLQLQVSSALGDRGPNEAPPPVGLQHGAVVWSAPWPAGFSLEAGRTALDYGVGRHIGRYDFHDSGHAFDGLRLRYAIPDVLAADLLAAKIRRNGAQPDLERNLTGLYFTGRPADMLGTDLYFLYVSDGTDKQVVRVLTMGARVDWKPAEWLRFEGEGALQVGDIRSEDRVAPRDHLATMAAVTAEAHGTFGAPLWLRAGGAFYSGDADPSDPITTGWRPLYPSLDRHVGILQLFEQRNLVQSSVHAGARPHAQWQVEVAAIATLARTGSPLPGFAKQVLAGDGGLVRVGTEIDGVATWQPHAVVELQGIAGFFVPAPVPRNDLGTDTAWQIWGQWTSRF